MGRSIPCPDSIEGLRAPPTPSNDVAKGFKSKILLVEDETLTRLMLAERFEALGHTVVEAAGADEALSLLRNGNAFDLLFTDIKMPGTIDGLEGLDSWIFAPIVRK